MSIRNTNTTELIVNIHKRVIEDNLKLLEENENQQEEIEKLKKENEELNKRQEKYCDKWYECDGLQEERRSLKAENEKLKAHIVQLEKYITVNCFIPNDSTTTRDDVKDALNDAKEVLDCLRPSI